MWGEGFAVSGAPGAAELRELLSEARGIVRADAGPHRSRAGEGLYPPVQGRRQLRDGRGYRRGGEGPDPCWRRAFQRTASSARSSPTPGGGQALTWVIDPIDGTKSFRHGVPLYGTLLALLHGEDPVLGIIDLPGLDRTYSAARGLGTRCNDEALKLEDLSAGEALEKEIIGIGDRQQFVSAGRTNVFDELMEAHPTGADLYRLLRPRAGPGGLGGSHGGLRPATLGYHGQQGVDGGGRRPLRELPEGREGPSRPPFRRPYWANRGWWSGSSTASRARPRHRR